MFFYDFISLSNRIGKIWEKSICPARTRPLLPTPDRRNQAIDKHKRVIFFWDFQYLCIVEVSPYSEQGSPPWRLPDGLLH